MSDDVEVRPAAGCPEVLDGYTVGDVSAWRCQLAPGAHESGGEGNPLHESRAPGVRLRWRRLPGRTVVDREGPGLVLRPAAVAAPDPDGAVVYVLSRGFGMEGESPVGVYSTAEKAAEAEARDREGIEGGGTYWLTRAYRVDARE